MEKTLESPLDCKEIQPVHSKGDQSWIFIGSTDAATETLILWPPHVKNWLIGKDSDAGGNWGQEEKGTTEDEMAGWRHRLDGHEFEWTLGVVDGQGGLACSDSWVHKELDPTEWLSWANTEVWIFLNDSRPEVFIIILYQCMCTFEIYDFFCWSFNSKKWTMCKIVHFFR